MVHYVFAKTCIENSKGRICWKCCWGSHITKVLNVFVKVDAIELLSYYLYISFYLKIIRPDLDAFIISLYSYIYKTLLIHISHVQKTLLVLKCSNNAIPLSPKWYDNLLFVIPTVRKMFVYRSIRYIYMSYIRKDSKLGRVKQQFSLENTQLSLHFITSQRQRA